MAREIGVSRERLGTHLQTSSRCQGWLPEDLECKRLMADLQLGLGAKEAAPMLGRSNEPRLLLASSKLTEVGRSLHAPERLIECIAESGKRTGRQHPQTGAETRQASGIAGDRAAGRNAGDGWRGAATPSEAPGAPMRRVGP